MNQSFSHFLQSQKKTIPSYPTEIRFLETVSFTSSRFKQNFKMSQIMEAGLQDTWGYVE